jgi:hypothetical protein
MTIYTLNWYAYAEVSKDLDGGFVAAFSSFEEAKAEMQRNVKLNASRHPKTEVTEDEFSTRVTREGYSVTFYISEFDNIC